MLKSKAQQAKMAQLEKDGKIKKGTAKRWEKATPDLKKLPERKAKVKSLDELKALAKKHGKR